MKTYHSIFFVLSFIVGFVLNAHNTEPDLKVNISSKVNSLELTDAGTVILSKNDGLAGVYHENSGRYIIATDKIMYVIDENNGGVGLLKLSKDNTEIEKELTTSDKKPEYVIDDMDNVLCCLSDNQTISIFKIQLILVRSMLLKKCRPFFLIV